MSERKIKREKKYFEKMLQDKVTETAEKLVTEKIQNELKEKDNMIFKIARQRDVLFLISIGLCVFNIITIVIILWNLS
jgi:hypothetical protein